MLGLGCYVKEARRIEDQDVDTYEFGELVAVCLLRRGPIEDHTTELLASHYQRCGVKLSSEVRLGEKVSKPSAPTWRRLNREVNVFSQIGWSFGRQPLHNQLTVRVHELLCS